MTAALLTLAAPAQARDVKQLELPASFAGLFCKDLQASNEVYEFFERSGHDCGPGKVARYLVVSPRWLNLNEAHCYIQRAAKWPSRRGDRYKVNVRCWQDGRADEDVLEMTKLDGDDAIMLTSKSGVAGFPAALNW
jgi:hypothetical protein